MQSLIFSEEKETLLLSKLKREPGLPFSHFPALELSVCLHEHDFASCLSGKLTCVFSHARKTHGFGIAEAIKLYSKQQTSRRRFFIHAFFVSYMHIYTDTQVHRHTCIQYHNTALVKN